MQNYSTVHNELIVTILAAGLGKRMKSPIPKVLHKVNDIPMLVIIIQKCLKLKPKKILVVVGKYLPIIEKTLIEHDVLKYITFVNQSEPLGTGHAVHSTLNYLDDNCYNLILNGDSPLIKIDTLQYIIDSFKNDNYDLQITSINSPKPFGCGRIITKNNKIINIIEEKDCNNEEKKINLINVGLYIGKTGTIKKIIPKINNNNVQNEYYLTDMVKIYLENNNNINLIKFDKDKLMEFKNINTKEQLDDINLQFI